jgi:hypothetical protein
MPPLEAATPAHRGDDAGRQENAMLGSSQISDIAKNHAFQPPSPAMQAAKAALVRELLGESLAIGIDCACAMCSRPTIARQLVPSGNSS